MKFDFNRLRCVFSHVSFWCVSNSFHIKFHRCFSMENGSLSFWGHLNGNCMWSNFNMNQASRFDTIKTWPKLGIHARRTTYKENFWIKIKIKLSENLNYMTGVDEMGTKREWDKVKADGWVEKRPSTKWFYLCQKSANVINLLQFYMRTYIIGLKSFNDFLCDDIGVLYSKDRQDFPFDKTNKITLTTHKST